MNKNTLPAALVLSLAILVAPVFSQGGKAEPKRITFRPGAISTPLSGTLRNGQEMDFVFFAKAGQTIKVTNRTKALFDFRIYSEVAALETEFDSSGVLTLDMPQSGDYLFFVRKKQVVAPKSARFSITLEIR
jgi:hypothetical protein